MQRKMDCVILTLVIGCYFKMQFAYDKLHNAVT